MPMTQQMKFSSYGSFKYESRKNIVKVSSLNPFLVHMSNVECLQLDARVGSKWKKSKACKSKEARSNRRVLPDSRSGYKGKETTAKAQKVSPAWKWNPLFGGLTNLLRLVVKFQL